MSSNTNRAPAGGSASEPCRRPRRLGRIWLASLGAALFTVAACGGNGASAGNAPKSGGATDIGVTADTINIVAIDDVTGPVPDLFKSSQQGIQAFAAYFNSTGGLYGRKLKVQLVDDRFDPAEVKAADQAACSSSFAIVADASISEAGGVSSIKSCGIPDITTISFFPGKTALPNVFSPEAPASSNYVSVGAPKYIAKTYPEAIKHAALLWADADTARQGAMGQEKADESVGFKFVYKSEVATLNPNYTPFVLAMKSAGVQYVTFEASFATISRMEQAMAEQNFFPQVRDWPSAVYSPDYLKLGPTSNGALIALNFGMFEEASSNPEMSLYLKWLNRTSPGATPDTYGMYAWSAGLMLQAALKAAGPDLTRAKVINTLNHLGKWDGLGLYAPIDVSGKQPSNCFMYVKVQDGKFVRLYPSSGYDCSSPLYKQS
jgi:ABC-type branched-subunit amino acid transport system substrate-binding protein